MTNSLSFSPRLSPEYFIVICEYKGEPYARELDREQLTNRRTVVADIATGQIEGVKRVLCARIGEPLEDVTYDICCDIWEGRGSQWSVRGDVLDLLQEHLGVTSAWAVA